MARIWSSGVELGSLTSGVEFSTVTSGVSISTTTVRSGSNSLRVTTTAGTRQGIVQQFAAAVGTGPYWLRTYININTLPSGGGATNFIALFSNGALTSSGVVAGVKLDSLGQLTLQYADAGAVFNTVGTSSALTTNQWYRIEIKVDNSGGAGAAIVEAAIDGVIFATTSTATLLGNVQAIRLGTNMAAETQTACTLFFDDIALNDGTSTAGPLNQNSYPGDGKIIHLRPNAAGDANTFATAVGGTAGSANNYTRISEVTPDDATSYNASNTLSQTDMVNITNSGIGTSDIVKVVQLGARFANITAASTSTAIQFQIEKTASGTKTSSSAIIPNTTTWNTNSTSATKNPILTLYQDPNSTNWTQSTLDTAQIGYIISTGSTRAIGVSAEWLLVEYTAPTFSLSDSVAVSENISYYSDFVDVMESVRLTLVNQASLSESSTVSESVTIAPPDLNVNVTDSSTVSENLVLAGVLAVSETVASSEFVRLRLSPIAQSSTATNAGASVTATLESTPTQGNLMVAWVYANKTNSVVSMSGWTLASALDFSLSPAQSFSLFFKNAGASESTSVTANATSATSMEIHVYEYSVSYTFIDQVAQTADTGVNVTSRSSGLTGTTECADELVVAGIGYNSDQGDSISWSNTFSEVSYTTHIAGADKIGNSLSIYQTTASWATGVRAVGIIATFGPILTVNVSDSSTVTESVNANRAHNLAISDSSTVSEFATARFDGVNLGDAATVSESVQIALITTADPQVSVSESSTVTDSPSHYSDSVDVNESVQIQIVTFTSTVSATASDNVTASESIGSYSDQVDVGERVQLQMYYLTEVGVSDQANTSEGVLVSLQSLNVTASDSVAVSESAIVLRGNAHDIVLVDNRLLDESGNPIQDENGNFITDETPGADFAITSESVQVFVYTDLAVTVSDSITAGEIVAVGLPPAIQLIFDAVAVTESLAVQFTTWFISVSDSSTASDVVITQNADINLAVIDNSTVSESIQKVFEILRVSVSNNVTVSESKTVQIPTTVVTIQNPPIILLTNGRLAIKLANGFYQLL